MFRTIIAAGLICVSSTCFAQVIQEVKPTKFGGGCERPMASLGAKFGTCLTAGNKARLWCPSGKVFERSGLEIQPALARSICGLNQVLDQGPARVRAAGEHAYAIMQESL